MKPVRMQNPPHPGEILRELCLVPLNLGVTDAAASLDASRNTLSAILNGRAGISPEMAIRRSIASDTTAESWLHQQMQYDLRHAEHAPKRLRVRKLAAAQVVNGCRRHDNRLRRTTLRAAADANR